jgi:transposase-like protein
MVAAVRGGASQRSVARRFGVALGTVQLWLKRAADRLLDQVVWSDRPPIAIDVRRTATTLEDVILDIRQALRDESVLGEYGPVAIRRELEARADLPGPPPSIRTIARIVDRRGALDVRRRVRRPAPPPGWYLPDLRAGRVELDSFDVISGLYLKGGIALDILTGISLHGGLPLAWPTSGLRSREVVHAIEAHWRDVGRPGYAQFDNDARFIGGTSVPDSIGLVIRFCLANAVVPVFAPPRETGFQAAIEAFNGRWQRKLWARFWDPSLETLQARSAAYIAASRQRSAVRMDAAPARPAMPTDRLLDRRQPVSGRLVFLRRTSDQGNLTILNRRYPVDPRWAHRLVRAELDIDAHRIDVFALRRRAPTDQPLITQLEYTPPERWFR